MAFNEILDTRYKTVKVRTSGPNYVESCQLAELGKCNSHNRPIRDICTGDLLMYLVIPIPSIFNVKPIHAYFETLLFIYISCQIRYLSIHVTTEVNLIISLGIRMIICTRYLN